MFLYAIRISELNIIIQVEINVNDGSIKYENEFEQNYMKVKDRIYKLYTENPGFYNHIIEQIGYGDLIDFHGMCIENVPLCWKGPDYDGWLDETWFLLEGFCIENDILYAQVSNYHSGPPDFEWLDIECVPNGILEYVLKLFKEKNKMEQKHHYTGLTDAQVLESRSKHGANILTPPEKEPLWKQFLEKFGDPLIIILLIAGVLSIGISCYEFWGLHEGAETFFEPVGIFVAILLATGIAFIFELKADKQFSVLNQVNDDEW